MKKTILCVEDNLRVQEYNKKLLEAKGFDVKSAMNLSSARAELALTMPDLIILDIHLPDGNGLNFLRVLRKASNIPVIALTNDKEESDIVTGFANGCDDYLPKPYTFPVLYAHVVALLRRAANVPDIVAKGSLSLDVMAGRAVLCGEDLLLTQKEFAVLLLLTQNEGKTLTAEYIYEKIWKQPSLAGSTALKNVVSRLRKKLGDSYSISNDRVDDAYVLEKLIR
ncbi:MAG: response regulator transcription factor [Clostridiales bacterium]|jgi:DNA-binding response OmpR family regulator|nr:response regulator transcription factor [Clostridiales bacterium]